MNMHLRPFYSEKCIHHPEKRLFSQVLATRRKGVVCVILLPYDTKGFSFFFKYLRDSYFFFPIFLETKTDPLLAVTSTTSHKPLSCKDKRNETCFTNVLPLVLL